jgi:hypothetical protein
MLPTDAKGGTMLAYRLLQAQRQPASQAGASALEARPELANLALLALLYGMLAARRYSAGTQGA